MLQKQGHLPLFFRKVLGIEQDYIAAPLNVVGCLLTNLLLTMAVKEL